MVRIRRCTIVVLVLASGLCPASTASAGPLLDWLGLGDCPPPSYSPCHFWSPAPVRLHDKCQGSGLNVRAPDRHPEIPPTFTILKYPCPAAFSAATIIEPPTPPPESTFKY